MTIPCGTVATFAGITLHTLTKAFKCVLRHVKRWPDFCKVLSMERFPERDNEHFCKASLSFGHVSTGG